MLPRNFSATSMRTSVALVFTGFLSLSTLLIPPGNSPFSRRAASGLQATETAAPSSPPNIVLIFVDDLGYGDLRPFGEPAYQTPHLDRLRREGRCLTDFSVSSAVCSSSRAALLTGCYHTRVSIHGALGPNSPIGIHPSETTLGELCQARGYATACIGKWHLGDSPEFLPLQNGFDEYYGLPYSNDMWPQHPDLAKLPAEAAARKSRYPNLVLYDGNQIVDDNVTAEDQQRLTTAYTQRAVDFIERHRNQPFLLYLPHSMVHVPLFVLPEHRGRSGHGLFADTLQEVDDSVGQILDTLKRLQLDEKTLLIFTSDNGPWLSYGDHAGSAGRLREGKGTSFEGGLRVPLLVRWPGNVPANTRCDEFASTIDLFPTIAKLLNAELPALPIDGLDISNLLFAPEPGPSPHDYFFTYYAGGQLQAVRDRQYKLLLPHRYGSLAGAPGGSGGSPAPYQQLDCPLSLFDLKADPGESHNLLESHPEIVARLQAAADQARARFGDTLRKQTGSEVRAAGKQQAR
ncbi:MAG: sulfatase [Planctomycetota bacterium]|jgi:arylsulfatase A